MVTEAKASKEKCMKLEDLRSALENSVGKIATTLSNEPHMKALREGMMFTLPFTLLGGIIMIMMFPPVTANATGFLAAWKAWGASSMLLRTPYNLTLGIISVYAVFGIAYSLAKTKNVHPGYASIISLFTFIVLAGAPVKSELGWGIPLGQLDAQGMFGGIILAMLTVEITSWYIKKGPKIKMPASVPPNIVAVFDYLFPLALNLVVFVAVNEAVKAALGFGIISLVQNIISPLLSFTDSLGSVIVINLLVIGFWFFGIHGAAMVASLIGPIQSANLAANAAAVEAGGVGTAILAGSYKSIFGTQIMFEALLIAVLIFAKNDRLRSLCKLSLVPNIFNINEPLIFGLPIVMNVTMIFPILITTILNTGATYLLMKGGFLKKVFVSTVATFPSPINAFLSTMDWKAPVVWFILFAINILIFAPFVRMYDKQADEEDAAERGE